MKKALMLGTSIAIAAGMFTTASAQDGDDVVIVTATKREQTLQETPVAVSVVDNEVIEKSQINDILDLQTVVPSLRVSQLQQSGNTTFLIRGFGNGSNNSGIEPSVGVFVDGVYRSRSAASLSDLPELRRVEVLRGPQSTLFGKNASAGVISFVTEEPQFDFGGSVEATLGNYENQIFKAYVTGPISDSVAFSLSGSSNKRDGFTKNLTTGQDITERDRWGIRGQLLFQPTDNLSIRLIGDYDEIDEACCYVPYAEVGPFTQLIGLLGGEFGSDPFAFETYLDTDPVNEISNGGVSGHVTYNFENFEFVSITSYREQELFQDGDVDFTSLPAIRSNVLDNNIETFTQELRLTSTGENKVDWMIGAFFFDETLDTKGNVIYETAFRSYADGLVAGLGAAGAFDDLEDALMLDRGTFFAAGTGSREFFVQENESWSGFGQLDFHVTENTTITLGANYTEDKKDVTGSVINNDVFANLDLVQVGFGSAFAAIAGVPPTPENLSNAAYAGAVAAASSISTTECSATNPPPQCNPLLPLQDFQFLPVFVNFPNAVESGQTSDDNWSYTARIAHDLAPNLNVYGSYATGFKASTWNLSRDSRPFPGDIAALETAGLTVPNLVAGTRYAGPEESEVFEIGMKATFSRGYFNMALFDQTIEGFQSAVFTGTGFVLANAGEQSTTGFEFDAGFSPIDPLTLTVAATFLDPLYDSFEGATGVNGPTDLSGTKPAGIHEMSLFFAADYQTDLGDGKTGFVRASYQYEDDVQVIENVPASILSREVNNVDASAGIIWDNGFELALWGRNLTDDQYFTSGFPTTTQTGSFSTYVNPPRTYGVTARKRF